MADEEHAVIKKEIEYLWKAVEAMKSNTLSLEKKHDDFTKDIGAKLDSLLMFMHTSKGSNEWVNKILWFVGTGLISVITFFAARNFPL